MPFKQSDGIKFQGFLKGDEYFSWIQTENKEVIVKNKFSRFYEFGMLAQDSEGRTQLQPSGVRVVERGISRRYLPIYLESIKRSDLGKISPATVWQVSCHYGLQLVQDVVMEGTHL